MPEGLPSAEEESNRGMAFVEEKNCSLARDKGAKEGFGWMELLLKSLLSKVTSCHHLGLLCPPTTTTRTSIRFPRPGALIVDPLYTLPNKAPRVMRPLNLA